MKKIIYTTFLGLACVVNTFAQKPAIVANDQPGWHKIGETTVDFGKDKDEVAVLLADRFASLKFKVTDAPIELLDIDVTYEEGDKQNIRVGYAIKKAGNESREIDLAGGAERKIKTITLHYKTIESRSDKKAHVEIWGKKTNAVKGKSEQTKQNNSEAQNGTRVKAENGKNEMQIEGQEIKKEAREESQEVKKETKEAVGEAKQEGKQVKKEAKSTGKEVKKEAKQEGREVKKETKKEAKEVKKEVKKEENKMKNEFKEQ